MLKLILNIIQRIASSTSLKTSEEPSKMKKILCNNCKTLLTDRENLIFYPFCRSSDIERI